MPMIRIFLVFLLATVASAQDYYDGGSSDTVTTKPETTMPITTKAPSPQDSSNDGNQNSAQNADGSNTVTTKPETTMPITTKAPSPQDSSNDGNQNSAQNADGSNTVTTKPETTMPITTKAPSPQDSGNDGNQNSAQNADGSNTVTTKPETTMPITTKAPSPQDSSNDGNQNSAQNADGSNTVTTKPETTMPITTKAPSPQDSGNDGNQNSAQNADGSNTATTPPPVTTMPITTPSAPITTTPPTTTTSTTTTSQTTTTNGLPSNPKINQICSGNRGMNDRIRTIALQGHNYRRSRLALGRVRKNNGAFLRPATNMIKLRYDCKLETSAKGVADKCTTSSSTLPAQVKENIHRIHRSSARFRTDAMIEAVKHWWSQVRLVPGIGMRAIFREKHEYSTIRYFTLMAWATTKYIGCAVSQSCGSYWYIVCHYRIGGNVVNENVYMPGRTCTQCPMGYYCDPSNGLCTKA